MSEEVIKLAEYSNVIMNRKFIKEVLQRFTRAVLKYRYLYIMLIPGIVFFIIFHYYPMYGVTIAFKDFQIAKGINASPWVGFKYFQQAFESPYFVQVTTNTIIISLYKLACGFPAPIILALMLNEVKNRYFSRIIQTITYLPHFISWVIIGGLLTDFLSPQGGLVNNILMSLDIKPIYFLASKQWFRSVLVISDIWKDVGWSSIIYLAALSSIDVQLYEAAQIDGANRLRQTWHVTLPGILSTVVILLILKLGTILNAGFWQIFILYNPAVYNVSDILDTWVYRTGIQNMQYSLATAVNLFKSIIALILVVITNKIASRLGNMGIW